MRYAPAMLRTVARFAIVLTASLLVVPSGAARADDKISQKPKATKTSVIALRAKLAKARDDMRTLAATPAPKGLTPEQRKAFDKEMQTVRALASGTNLTVKTLDAEIDKVKSDLDSMSEMGEMESLRLQMAMDRMSKMMSTLSNLLKKISDTASQITQNLK